MKDYGDMSKDEIILSYEAMKEGVEVRLSDQQAEFDRLQAQLAERDTRIGELEQERDTYKKCSGLAERERLVNVLGEVIAFWALDLLREVECRITGSQCPS